MFAEALRRWRTRMGSPLINGSVHLKRKASLLHVRITVLRLPSGHRRASEIRKYNRGEAR
jgi:hypothetical protein